MYTNKGELRLKEIYKFFLKRWNEIKDEIEYSTAWEKPIRNQRNVADRFEDLPYNINGIHSDPVMAYVPVGKVIRMRDSKQRRFILVGTRLGLAVMYEVAKDLRGDRLQLSCNPAITAASLRPHLWTIEDYAAVIGSPNGIRTRDDFIYRNIGEWIELTANMLQSETYRPHNVRLAHVKLNQ